MRQTWLTFRSPFTLDFESNNNNNNREPRCLKKVLTHCEQDYECAGEPVAGFVFSGERPILFTLSLKIKPLFKTVLNYSFRFLVSLQLTALVAVLPDTEDVWLQPEYNHSP